jgi:hypothetical protein
MVMPEKNSTPIPHLKPDKSLCNLPYLEKLLPAQRTGLWNLNLPKTSTF